MLWRASRESIADSARSAHRLAQELGLRSLAFPLIGAGSGGFPETEAERILIDALAAIETDVEVTVVRFRR